MRLIAAILGVCVAFFSTDSVARDLGTIGPVFPIAETDAIVLFQSKARARVDSGEHARWMDEARVHSKQKARRPAGTQLPRAAKHRVTQFDPRITLGEDLRDDKGNIIYPAGTVVNPLAIKPLTKTLCFIDGDDPEQVQWIDQYCTDDVRNKLILVNGDIEAVSKQIDHRLYFDQRSFLVSKFGIAALPAAIRQHGEALYVEEFPIQ